MAKTLQNLRAARKRKKLFLIANGGSIALEKQPLERLKNYDTIACNGWYPNGKRKFGFHPTYHCVGDVKYFITNLGFWKKFKGYDKTNCIFLFGGRGDFNGDRFFRGKDYIRVKEYKAPGLRNDGHDDANVLLNTESIWNLENGLYARLGQQDVTAFMLITAFYLGYKKIYVVGVDYGPKYTGYFWNLSRQRRRKPTLLAGRYKAWSIINERAKKIGAQIYMCNSKKYNKLDLFPRVPFEEAAKK